MVVGDINVDSIEAKIKKLFSPIEMPANAAERTYFPVPDNDEPIITVAGAHRISVPLTRCSAYRPEEQHGLFGYELHGFFYRKHA